MAACDEKLARAEAAGAAGPTDNSAAYQQGSELSEKAVGHQDWLLPA